MVTYRISGMTCGHCVKAVEKALSRVPGVTQVLRVDLAKGEAQLEGNPRFEEVVAAVKGEGYEATLVA
jgi:copper chaperone